MQISIVEHKLLRAKSLAYPHSMRMLIIAWMEKDGVEYGLAEDQEGYLAIDGPRIERFDHIWQKEVSYKLQRCRAGAKRKKLSQEERARRAGKMRETRKLYWG